MTNMSSVKKQDAVTMSILTLAPLNLQQLRGIIKFCCHSTQGTKVSMNTFLSFITEKNHHNNSSFTGCSVNNLFLITTYKSAQ